MIHRSFRAGVLLALALAACGDGGTGPGPSISITLTANASEPVISVDPVNGAPRSLTCDLSFHARAAVDGDASAEWVGAKFRYFAGAASGPALDSVSLSAVEVSRSFGNNVLLGGELRSSSWRVAAGRPFRVEGTFTWRTVGRTDDRSATATAVCAPGGELAPGPAPTLRDVSVVGPASELAPGDTLTISWTAVSESGLWETGVLVDGAFAAERRVAARGSRSLPQVIKLVVPPGALLGQPVRLTVFAVDVSLQAAGEGVQRGPVLDRAAPALLRASVDYYVDNVLAGQYAATDSIGVWLDARDNHALAWLLYELPGAGVADSVALPGAAVLERHGVKIPLPPGWSGATELRMRVRDAAGLRSPVTASPPGAVRVYPVRALATRSAQLASQPIEVAVAGGRLYTLLLADHRVLVHSLPELQPGAHIQMPAQPTAIEVTASGDSLLVALPDLRAMAVIDIPRGTFTQVPLPGEVRWVTGIKVAANGKAIVLAVTADGEPLVVEHDLRTGQQRTRADARPSDHSDAMARSRDRSRLLLGGGCVYESAADRFTCLTLPGNGNATADATGRRWARNQLVLNEDFALVRDLGQSVGLISYAALSGDGGVAWASTARHLLRMDVATGRVLEGSPLDAFGGWWRLLDDERTLVGFGPGATFGWRLVSVQLP